MKKITRVELISMSRGRMLMYATKEYSNSYGIMENIMYDLQDNRKTLKIFID